MLAYAFVCLATYYLCRVLPLRLAVLPRVVGTHLTSAAASALLLVAAAHGLMAGLGLLGVDMTASAGALPIVFALGLLLFLLASALNYALLAAEQSRLAEHRALEFQLLSRDAELKTLRAQIHPHFLFNALNSISALTGSDPRAARQVCVLLGEFLRRSLTFGTLEVVTLAQELDLADALLRIEQVRFGARLQVQIDVHEQARACLVPPLILQTLVENAVTHGVAGLLDGGRIRLAAQRLGERVQIEVENPRDPEGRTRGAAGVGLENVKRRLAAFYGDSANVGIEAEPSRFLVRLSLPAKV
jgi:LytS/YehU family sensor histidine kinase